MNERSKAKKNCHEQREKKGAGIDALLEWVKLSQECLGDNGDG